MEKITEKILNEFHEQDGQRRNIAFDLDAATADFNPLEETQEPLVISESVGKYTVKSIKHLFPWNQEA